MLHAGIGPTHVNALLTSVNLPAVGESTLKAREREVGPAIEEVAKRSCLDALQAEKRYWTSKEVSDEPASVAIGASYDMGWQKRGKGHNSLTGNYIWCLSYAVNQLCPDMYTEGFLGRTKSEILHPRKCTNI